MKRETKILTSLLVAQALCTASVTNAASPTADLPEEVVLFKIHDIVPEKDPDGKVLFCNIGATFFNRTKSDIANVSMNLSWEDEVIIETVEQEERATREIRRSNPRANVSRYPTSALNDQTVTMSLKLPPIKMNQQVSLKAKVATERCFILLNEMDINVTNCGTAGDIAKASCSNMFRYISPKMPEYYQEFKEKSLEEETAAEDAELNSIKKDIEDIYNETLQTVRNITNEQEPVASNEEKSKE